MINITQQDGRWIIEIRERWEMKDSEHVKRFITRMITHKQKYGQITNRKPIIPK